MPVFGNRLLPLIKQGIVLEHAGKARQGMFFCRDFNGGDFRAFAKAALHRLLQMQKGLLARRPFRGHHQGQSRCRAVAVALHRFDQDRYLHDVNSPIASSIGIVGPEVLALHSVPS